MIRVENLVYRYDAGAPDCLRGISLDIEEGAHTALIGPNGCGKTTLIKHLNALLFPRAGTVCVDGMMTTDAASVREIRRRVGMVFQNPDSQIVGMTVEEDVAFGPGNLALPSAEIRRRVDECLAMVGMTGFEKRAPHTLSGGEKRLLSIAGVLAMNPRYIAFDEPTAYLDPAGKQRVLEIIRQLNRAGMAIIHIAHDMRDVAGADRVVVMDRGQVLLTGTPAEVFEKADLLISVGLDGLPGEVRVMIHLGQYLPDDTVIHRLDPRVKILSVVALSILIFAATPAEILLISVFLVAVVRRGAHDARAGPGGAPACGVLHGDDFSRSSLLHRGAADPVARPPAGPDHAGGSRPGDLRDLAVCRSGAGRRRPHDDDVPLRSRRRDRAAPPAALQGGDPVAGPRRDDRDGAPFHADAPGGVRPAPDGADGAGRRFHDRKPCPCGRAPSRRSPFRCSSPPSAAPTNSPLPWRHGVTGAAPGPRSGNWRFPAAIWAPSPSWPYFFS